MNEENKDQGLTFGDKAVGASFNPSGNLAVNELKAYYAAIIDFLHDQPGTDDEMRKRLYDMALEDAIRAQMSAVKYITWDLPRE